MIKNVIVAQSGGPSPVINNSLRGIIDTCKMFPKNLVKFMQVGMVSKEVLKEELLDLTAQSEEEISLLRTTPAAGSIVGTCRYKLKDKQKKDFERVIDIFKAHNVGYFFYIGGNDSQHTAFKVSELAKEKDLTLLLPVFLKQLIMMLVIVNSNLLIIPPVMVVLQGIGLT